LPHQGKDRGGIAWRRNLRQNPIAAPLTAPLSAPALTEPSGGSDRHQAEPRFLGFFLRQALLLGGNQIDNIAAGRLGGGAWRFFPFAWSSISFFTSSV
jgi:hypothetical protein